MVNRNFHEGFPLKTDRESRTNERADLTEFQSVHGLMSKEAGNL